MLIHSAGGEARLMKMHVFPKLFHLYQMIHPALLLSNINEIKSTFTKCTWPRHRLCLTKFSGLCSPCAEGAGQSWGSLEGDSALKTRNSAHDCR